MIRVRQMLLLLTVTFGLCVDAHAACTITGFSTITPSSANVGSYTVSTTPSTYAFTFTVSMTISTTGGACKGALALQRNSAPAQMLISPAGASTLPYDVTAVGSSASVIHFGATTVTKFIPLPAFSPIAGSKSATVSVTVSIQPGTSAVLPLAGFYMDQSLALRGYDTSAAPVQRGQMPFVVTANVLSGCGVTTNGSLALDFSSDIVAGVPAGAAKSLSMLLNCNAAARIMVSSAAMLPTPAPAPVTGFDTLINFQAQASMTGASAVLTTKGATPVTATSTSQITSLGSNLPLTVMVGLVPGLPLRVGTYKSVLRVIVDPAL